jgi:hypothetical protein
MSDVQKSIPAALDTPKAPIRVYRHELKYFINFQDYLVLRDILAGTLNPDPHGGPEREYWIRSLYFDSGRNDDYYEKMIGTSERKKIRLRIYDTAARKVKLEIKNKFELYMLKETATLTRREAMDLIAGKREVLLDDPNSTRGRAYYFMSRDFYKPAVIIDYEREAYICDVQNIRLTFDKNIRAGFGDFNIFDENLNMKPVFERDAMVLEVKYNRFFPDWLQRILGSFPGDRAAIGKYCYGRWLF